jgi:DNA-binding transcriptional MerR regulator
MSKTETAKLLTAVVDVRLAIREAREPAIRGTLRKVEHSLTSLLGPSVPKRQAARLLGVSVVALDLWIDRGRLPVVAAPGNTRLGVETRSLLDLAEQVELLRRQGVKREQLAQAFAVLGWADDPAGRHVLRAEIAALPRPNVSARQLRRDFEQTTPEERLAQLDQLNRSMNALVGGRH